MTSPKFLLLVAALGAFALSSCQTPPSPAAGVEVRWPDVAFKEVRAYCYDYTAESRSSFFIEGRMHRGVMDPRGVKLSAAQVKRLLADITISQPAQKRTNCYRPHHAYVFYGAKGEISAVFEMCFGCNQFVATPGGVPRYINTTDLYRLTHELGLPLGNGNAYYTEVCRGGVKRSR